MAAQHRKSDSPQPGSGSRRTRSSRGHQHRLKQPKFGVDDVEARRAWLWTLAYNAFQQRVSSIDKPADTRFVMHLSELLGLGPAANDNRKGNGGLGDFLDGLTPDEFAEYKQQD